MERIMLRIDHVSKEYILGQIGGTTLRDELQRLKARIRHREDPTKRIGAKDYNKGEHFLALDNVSFDVNAGERVGIIGHNGAGKSTLLKLISRVTAPTKGLIGLNGRITSMLEVGTGFHPELTGRENIYMNGAILGMTKREIDAKMEDIIDFSECRQFIDTPVKRYSSGMYVKLAFSVAAHLDSEIMIMDEVLAVGDMAFQKKCLEKMNDVSRKEGKTILYVSHNMNTIRQLCDRCLVLNHGNLEFDGNVEEGIEEYMGIRLDATAGINLQTIERDPEFSPHPVTIIRILNQKNENNSYNVGEEMRIRIDCNSDKDIDEAYLRIIIKNLEGTVVTMHTSDHGVLIKHGEENHLYCALDNTRLAPGRYTLSPVIYEVNPLGANANLDGLKDVYSFDILQTEGFNNNMIWQSRYWGFVFNKPMRLIRE